MLPTKNFGCIFVLCTSFILNIHYSFTLTIPDRDHLRLRILEFDSVSRNLVQVLTSRNSDIINGEDVGENGAIVLECRSSYGPVTLSYKGDGDPEYTTNTNTTRTAHGLYFWTFLSFSKPLSAKDNGNFTCVSVNDPQSQNSVHFFVPDSTRSVFVPSRLEHRLEYPKANHFRIPCSVVHPRAKVTLEKLSKNFHSDSSNTQITYSPKSGFYIPVSMVNSGEPTTFLCKASFRGKYDEAEYKIFSEASSPELEIDTEQIRPPILNPNTRHPSSSLRSACTGSTCGQFAECIVIDYAAHCVCYENYTGDPWKICSQMSEHSQQYVQEDPCSPNPCGRNNPCVVVNRHAVCACQGNHHGTPTICRSTTSASKTSMPTTSSYCTNNNDCAWNEHCNKRFGSCENVCNGSIPFCGQNSRCYALNHDPLCECFVGFKGNPYVSKNSQGCQPPLAEEEGKSPNKCNALSCGINARCKVNHRLRHLVCSCPEGFTGNAKIKCFNIKNAEISEIGGGSLPNNTSSNLNFHKNLCNLTRCGIGAKCRVIGSGSDVHCFCPTGTRGNPAVRCDPVSPEADIAKACDVCGPNSVCTITGRKVVCGCALNATGVPPNCAHTKRASCRDNFDCSDDNVCDRGRCLNPCSWICSETSSCTVLKHTIKCECPPDHEGDPRFGCRRMEKAVMVDLDHGDEHPCKINCGPNTVCRAVMLNELEKYRNTLRQSRQEALYFDMIRANGNLQQGIFSECLCRKGYQGNPYAVSGCKPGVDESAVDYPVTIVMEPNPCDPSPCGSNSLCRSYNGNALCSCNFDSSGQPPNCKHRCKADSHCLFNESCIRGLCQEGTKRV